MASALPRKVFSSFAGPGRGSLPVVPALQVHGGHSSLTLETRISPRSTVAGRRERSVGRRSKPLPGNGREEVTGISLGAPRARLCCPKGNSRRNTVCLCSNRDYNARVPHFESFGALCHDPTRNQAPARWLPYGAKKQTIQQVCPCDRLPDRGFLTVRRPLLNRHRQLPIHPANRKLLFPTTL